MTAATTVPNNAEAEARTRTVSIEWANWDPSLGEAEERALAGLVFGRTS